MKIIETNIMYDGLTFYDHQSRVLEIPSWEEYCDLYRNYNGEAVRDKEIECKDVYGTLLEGNILSKNANIISLKIDEYHLMCDMNRHDGTPQYKLAYVLER